MLDGPPTERETKTLAARVVRHALWNSLPFFGLVALGSLYGAFSALAYAGWGFPEHRGVSALLLVGALLAFAGALVVRRREASAPVVRAWMVAAGLGNALASALLFRATGEPGLTPFLGIMLIASAYFYHDRRDLTLVVGSVLVAFLVGWTSPVAKPGWRLAAIQLGAALVASGVLRTARRNHLEEFERLRLERDRREQQLRASEALWRGFTENARDLIVLLDTEGRALYLNPRFSEITGFSAERLLRQDPLVVLAPEFRAAGRDAIASWWSGNEDVHTFELEVAGEKRWVEAVAAPISIDLDTRGLLVFGRDVTERRALDQRLRAAQKEEGLSLMAAGVAHDFNNLLAVALVETELAREEGSSQTLRERLSRIEGALVRSRTLTQLLLVYSGSVASERESLDLTEQVEQIHDLVRSSISREVELRLDLASGLPAVEADSVQVQQAVMNLIWNASEACSGPNARVRVRTGCARLSKQDVDALQPAEERRPGLYAWAEVRDNGHGIPAGALRRIFDPFYSTRDVGRGLGLAAVIGIARAHAGGIHVESEEGEGSLFRLYFPVAEVDGDSDSAESQPRGIRVLLVMRDPTQRDAYMETLRSLGHEVLACEGPTAGIEALRSGPGRFDLVVSDAAPEERDPLGAEALRRVAPDLPMLLASDSEKSEASLRAGARSPIGRLATPTSRVALANAIDELLAAAAGP